MSGDTVVYRARRIRTHDPARPLATHVAVRDGRVLAVGDADAVAAWGPARLDERYADAVLLPGFVEGHSHLMEGAFWRHVWCGRHDRVDPDGRVWPGVDSIDAVVARLRAALDARPGDAPLVGWGFDPIHWGGRRCTRADLDRVSATRPVVLAHASLHILNANSAALAAGELLRPGIDHPGVPLGDDGLPAGELRGPDAMTPVANRCGLDRTLLAGDVDAIRAFGRLCVRTGTTTATDLASPLPDEAVGTLLRETASPDCPVRLVPLLRLLGQPVPQAIARALALRSRSTDGLRLGRIKVVADGSIQGFTARLRWPGYVNGAPDGLWYVAPETLRAAYREALAAGVQIHTHTNGDAATELALDCLEDALRAHPSPDHRFVLQHCQLADAAQYRRMKALGASVNLFANHHFFWGDQHLAQTVGPDRAERMNACRTALETGVPFAIHSDAPVTPLAPLFTAWCAVNRLTASGRTLGAHERIGVADALRAITLGAAHTLHLDGEIGSIECGKRADFAVLGEDPHEVDPGALKDVPVRGTVKGGRPFDAVPA